MDLGAFAQIEDLGEVARKNGIVVPRERGYRYMKEEDRISNEDIARSINDNVADACEEVLRQCGPLIYEYSSRTDRLVKRYMIKGKRCFPDGEEYTRIVGVRWDTVHGKLRKKMKFASKKAKAAMRAQLEAFNKYCGREDVLYIHARIGGWNWNDYGGPELERQPWFLEKIDDAVDSTYCDIYAKIDPATINNQ